MSTRKDERFPINQRATVHDAAHDVHLPLVVRDISAGGLFVSTDHQFVHGSAIEIELHLAGDAPLRLPGVIVHTIDRAQAAQWGRPFGAGVQFGALDQEQALRLEAFLRTVARRLADELRSAPFETSLLMQLERGHRMGDLFAVLGLEPTSDVDQIRAAAQGRADVLNGLLDAAGLSDSLRKRVIAARLAAQQAAALLGDEHRRTAYLARATEHISAAAASAGGALVA